MTPRSLAVLALAALPLFPLRADESPMQAVAAFVRALERNEWRAYDPISSDPVVSEDPDWSDVAQLIEIRSCVEVRRWGGEVTENDGSTAVVRLTIDGMATSKSSPSRHVPLPRNWTVAAVRRPGGWRIRMVMQTDRFEARRILSSKRSDPEAILGANGDLPAILRNLTDLGLHSGDARPFGYGYDDPAQFSCHLQELTDSAVRLAGAVGDAFTESYCLRMRSSQKRVRGDVPGALADAVRALDLARSTGDADALSGGLFVIGLAQWLSGDLDQAIQSLTEAVANADSLDDPRAAMKALTMVMHITRLRGDLRGALMATQRLDEMARHFQWIEGEAVAAAHAGNIHYALQDFEVAEREYDHATEALRLCRKQSFLAMTTDSRAQCAMARHDGDRALQLLREALAIGFLSGSPLANVHMDVGCVLTEKGQYDAAEKECLAALQTVEDNRTRSDALTCLSRVDLARHKADSAVRYAHQALSAAGESGPIMEADWSPWPARTALALGLRGAGRNAEAVAAFREAIAVIEADRAALPLDELSSARYFDDKLEPYAELADLLVALGRDREAFAIAEQARARTLDDAMRQARPGDAGLSEAETKETEALHQRVVDLNKRILALPDRSATAGNLRQELEAARFDLERFDTNLAATHPELRIKSLSAPAGETKMPVSLRRGAVVEYLVGKRRTIAFVVTAVGRETRIHARFLRIDRETLARRVHELTNKMQRRDHDYRATARRLYDLLLTPLEPLIGEREMVCIIPHEVLWQLPFQVLLSPDGHAVIERHAVFYAPSLTMLLAAERSRHGASHPAELLAFGNPDVAGNTQSRARSVYRDATLGPLPDAESEVRALALLYDVRRTRVFTRGAAREATFKREAPRYRVLHLAMHALVDDRAPMFSALVMSPGDTDEHEDGLLEANEILRMKLSAEIAVLSACETARGSIGGGEGVIGISWAFLAAGCPTTVVSEWKASSAATAQLMIDFHRQMIAGVPKAEALRRAQRTLMRDPRYAHPFYWAAFVMVGSGT